MWLEYPQIQPRHIIVAENARPKPGQNRRHTRTEIRTHNVRPSFDFSDDTAFRLDPREESLLDLNMFYFLILRSL